MKFFRILPRNAAWFSWWSTRVHSVKGGGLCGTCHLLGGCEFSCMLLETDFYHMFINSSCFCAHSRLLLMSGLTSASLIGFAGSCATWTQVLSSQLPKQCWSSPPPTATYCYYLLLGYDATISVKVIEGQGLPVVCTNSRGLKIVLMKVGNGEAQGAAVSPTSLHRLRVGGDSAGGGSGGSENSLSGTTEAWDCHRDECLEGDAGKTIGDSDRNGIKMLGSDQVAG